MTGRYRAVAFDSAEVKDQRAWHSIARSELAHCMLAIGEASAAGVNVPQFVPIYGDKSAPVHAGWGEAAKPVPSASDSKEGSKGASSDASSNANAESASADKKETSSDSATPASN